MGLDSIMGAEIIQTLENDFEIYIFPKEIRNLTFAKYVNYFLTKLFAKFLISE